MFTALHHPIGYQSECVAAAMPGPQRSYVSKDNGRTREGSVLLRPSSLDSRRDLGITGISNRKHGLTPQGQDADQVF